MRKRIVTCAGRAAFGCERAGEDADQTKCRGAQRGALRCPPCPWCPMNVAWRVPPQANGSEAAMFTVEDQHVVGLGLGREEARSRHGPGGERRGGPAGQILPGSDALHVHAEAWQSCVGESECREHDVLQHDRAPRRRLGGVWGAGTLPRCAAKRRRKVPFLLRWWPWCDVLFSLVPAWGCSAQSVFFLLAVKLSLS